jgi:hypothetical protein
MQVHKIGRIHAYQAHIATNGDQENSIEIEP